MFVGMHVYCYHCTRRIFSLEEHLLWIFAVVFPIFPLIKKPFHSLYHLHCLIHTIYL